MPRTEPRASDMACKPTRRSATPSASRQRRRMQRAARRTRCTLPCDRCRWVSSCSASASAATMFSRVSTMPRDNTACRTSTSTSVAWSSGHAEVIGRTQHGCGRAACSSALTAGCCPACAAALAKRVLSSFMNSTLSHRLHTRTWSTCTLGTRAKYDGVPRSIVGAWMGGCGTVMRSSRGQVSVHPLPAPDTYRRLLLSEQRRATGARCVGSVRMS